MTKPLAVLPDAEREVIDYLTLALASQESTATVGLSVPSTWLPKTSAPFVQVASDGTSSNDFPIKAEFTMRITAWAKTPTIAKALASLCEGLLLSFEGSRKMPRVLPGTSVIGTRDPDSKAELASITVQATFRYQVL
jgi:hypothetical protein